MKMLTTGQVAEICGCAPKTVSKWVDSGLLAGYKLPGGGDRRIKEADLREFMAKHGMTFPEPSESEGDLLECWTYANSDGVCGGLYYCESAADTAMVHSGLADTHRVIRLREVR